MEKDFISPLLRGRKEGVEKQMLTANELKYYSSLKHKKFREKEGKFLIEGKHLIEECLNSFFNLEVIIVDEKQYGDKEIFAKAKENNVRIEKVKHAQINKLSETNSPPGIIGVVEVRKEKTIDFSDVKLVLALDTINDPGNLGTIIRTAYWFGVDRILISRDSVEVYNSKVVRASQGAVFHVNFSEDVDLLNELKFFRTQGFTIYALTTHTKKKLNDTQINKQAVFLSGNESAGLSDKFLRAGFENVKIEGYSNCESLNVGVSIGIALEKYRNSV